MSQSTAEMGVLVHGRHLGAVDWERLEMGEAPHRFGVLPILAKLVLDHDIDGVGTIVFGTGASERDGTLEGEYTKGYLLDHVDELGDFPRIARHPAYQTAADRLRLALHFEQRIIPETTSQNTSQEIAAAAGIFAKVGINDIIAITNGAHAARCVTEAVKARRAGAISSKQAWSVMPDEMDFGGALPVVLEPPHRGDDHALDFPEGLQAHEVAAGLFRVQDPAEKLRILTAFRGLLEEAGVLPSLAP